MSFIVGKRRCLGEHIGRMEFILFFAGLMQKCRLEQEPGKPIDIEPVFNFTQLPNHFKVIVKPRY